MLFKLLIVLVMLAPQQERLADRIVAIVNDEPIMLSELHQSSMADLSAQPDQSNVLQSRLESRINQTLILQEARRLRIFSVTPAEIEEYRAQLLQQFDGDQGAMLARMAASGVRPEEINAVIERLLLIREFVDYRFRRSVQLEEEDLLNYYETTFSEDFRRRNPMNPVPQFESVRSLIRTLLIERNVNDAIQQWLADARARAQIVIRF